jgi:hypothetical protein
MVILGMMVPLEFEKHSPIHLSMKTIPIHIFKIQEYTGVQFIQEYTGVQFIQAKLTKIKLLGLYLKLSLHKI